MGPRRCTRRAGHAAQRTHGSAGAVVRPTRATARSGRTFHQSGVFVLPAGGYLGWKDTLASPRNSERQRAYAKARGDGAIYTPQVVVNGMNHVNGALKADIMSAIEQTQKELATSRVPLWFWQEANTLTIWLGVVQSTATVEIKQGENTGKTLVYTNVVRELTPIGLWKGQVMRIQIPRAAVMLPETQKSVVLIQEGKAGPIIAAAWAGLF